MTFSKERIVELISEMMEREVTISLIFSTDKYYRGITNDKELKEVAMDAIKKLLMRRMPLDYLNM